MRGFVAKGACNAKENLHPEPNLTSKVALRSASKDEAHIVCQSHRQSDGQSGYQSQGHGSVAIIPPLPPMLPCTATAGMPPIVPLTVPPPPRAPPPPRESEAWRQPPPLPTSLDRVQGNSFEGYIMQSTPGRDVAATQSPSAHSCRSSVFLTPSGSQLSTSARSPLFQTPESVILRSSPSAIQPRRPSSAAGVTRSLDRRPSSAGARKARPGSARSASAKDEDESSEPLRVFSAARHGRYQEVQAALESGFNPTYSDKFGNTLFHVACQNGNKRVGKLAIKFGGHMDAQNKKGNTGVHFLFTYNYPELGEYFISKGANPHVKNHVGNDVRAGIT